jgi:hypothetical protein
MLLESLRTYRVSTPLESRITSTSLLPTPLLKSARRSASALLSRNAEQPSILSIELLERKAIGGRQRSERPIPVRSLHAYSLRYLASAPASAL